MIPLCPFRPTQQLVTEFITPNNYAVKTIADKLRALFPKDDDFILAVATYIRDDFIYPNDLKGRPASALLFCAHDITCYKWLLRKRMDYAWFYPNETIAAKGGICIDTALLFVSILIAGGIHAKVALGAIVEVPSGNVVGYHAWGDDFIYKGRPSIGEMTIHFKAMTIVDQASVYNPDSDWAKSNLTAYSREANMDNIGYTGFGSLGLSGVQFMGLPASRVKYYGLNTTLEVMERKQRAIMKEWRQCEALTHSILSKAYGGG